MSLPPWSSYTTTSRAGDSQGFQKKRKTSGIATALWEKWPLPQATPERTLGESPYLGDISPGCWLNSNAPLSSARHRNLQTHPSRFLLLPYFWGSCLYLLFIFLITNLKSLSFTYALFTRFQITPSGLLVTQSKRVFPQDSVNSGSLHVGQAWVCR